MISRSLLAAWIRRLTWRYSWRRRERLRCNSIRLGSRFQRSGTGIRNYAVRSSVDGYAANLPASINPANANLGVGATNEFRWLSDALSTAQNGSLITLGASFADLTSPVSFRFYGWNAEGSVGTFSIDNVSFTGSSRNVPEPTIAALLGVGLAVCAAWRLRVSRT